MKQLAFLLILLYSTSLFSQDKNWNLILGGKGNDELTNILQSTKGEFIIVGKKNSDISFITTNIKGEKLIETSIDLKENATPTCLTQSRKNHFWVGGNQINKNIAFLLKVDPNGTPQDTFFLAPQTKIFDIVGKDFSKFWAVGEKEGELMVIHFNNEKIVWEESYTNEFPRIGKQIILLSDDTLLIAGNEKQYRKKSQIFLTKININGEVITDRIIKDDSPITKVNKIALDKDGGLLIAGSSQKNPKSFKNIFTYKEDINGKILWQNHFGSTGRDEANAIALGVNGERFIAGLTQTDNATILRKSKIFVNQIDDNGTFLKNQNSNLFGGKRNDNALDMLTAFDGSLIVVGYSETGNSNKKDAWIKRIGLLEEVAKRPATAKLNNIRLIDENENGTLDFGESGELRATILNTSEEDIFQLKVNIKSDAQGINFEKTLAIGFLGKGKKAELVIHLNGIQGIQNTTAHLELTFSAKNKLTMESQKIPVRTQEKVRPELRFNGNTFVVSNNEQQRNFLFVNLENIGGIAAKKVQVRFFPSKNIKTKSSKELIFEKVKSNTSKIAFLEFEKTGNDDTTDEIVCQILISGFKDALDSTFVFNHILPENSRQGKEQLVWINPIPESKYKKSNTTFQQKVTAKVVLISPYPLSNKELKFSVRKPNMQGSKIRRVTPAHHIRSEKQNGYYLHYLTSDLKLTPKKNIISVKINRPELPKIEDVFVLKYVQPKPKLFLLSVGVPYTDLQYTDDDAIDFAAAIAAQKGVFYQDVQVTLLKDSTETSASKIREALQDLVDLQITNQIRPFDVVMIFISSHGDQVEKSDGTKAFKIVTQNEGNKTFDALDFEVDILDRLAQINCHRINFIDACHSGTTITSQGGKTNRNKVVGEALNQIIAANPNVYTFTSSRGNELSWEDPTWQNGAFTKALLEIILNKKVDGIQPNVKIQNNYQTVFIEDIESYLSLRVPQLINEKFCKGNKSENTNCGTVEQNPILIKKETKSKLPVLITQ